MTIPTLNRRQSQEVDRRAVAEYGMAGLVLMENAGRGTVDVLCRLGIAGPVVVCCGRGHNGGDGFVIARHLDLRGHAVRVGLWCDPASLQGDAAANYAILARSGVPIDVFGNQYDAACLAALLDGAAWIVDALLGTGSHGDPRPPMDAVIDALNAHSAAKLAVDLPSGLDGDTGAVSRHTIRAAHTCTFVAQKPGFLMPGAAAYTGQVHVLDIGAPRKLIEECLIRAHAG
ncbi:MAG TPA: NAD(P)H-hydrate epimerase [Pirellulales bacterium]|nr:NAD(P)H-hydrate epimerase [Pirellulales bacterium]